MADRVLDLFCGGGGASVGMHLLGFEVVGVDFDADACTVHARCGWPTIRWDLTVPFPVRPGTFDGAWISCPCTAWSAAGKGEGRKMADRLVAAIDAEDFSPWPDVDPAVWLMLPSLETALAAEPRWMAWENVAAVRPAFEAIGRVLERHGYRTVVVDLDSECFGVAQTRSRCFLLARRDGTITPPSPTHQRYVHGEAARREESLFGTIEPWVSMAEALHWGTRARPFPTIATSRTTGGPDYTCLGGSGARDMVSKLAADDDWLNKAENVAELNTGRDWKKGGDREDAQTIPVDNPAPTVSSKSGGQWQWRLRMTTIPNSAERSPDLPAPTMAFGHDAASARWIAEQTSEGNWVGEPVGDVCPGCGCSWDVHDGGGFCAGECGGNVCDGGGWPDAVPFWSDDPEDESWQARPCVESPLAKTKEGYGQKTIGSRTDGTRRNVGHHRYVFCNHYGLDLDDIDGLSVMHRCDNPPCIEPTHLVLGTTQDNSADMARKGRHHDVGGENHPRAKLTENDVASIREDRAIGVPLAELAEQYGVSMSHISRIARGGAWEKDIHKPSTTVAGDQRLHPRGHKVNQGDRDRRSDADERYGDRAGTNAIRLTIEEAARLQATSLEMMPLDGLTKTSQFKIVGNMVPPVLASYVAGAAAGLDPGEVRAIVTDYVADLYSHPA